MSYTTVVQKDGPCLCCGSCLDCLSGSFCTLCKTETDTDGKAATSYSLVFSGSTPCTCYDFDSVLFKSVNASGLTFGGTYVVTQDGPCSWRYTQAGGIGNVDIYQTEDCNNYIGTTATYDLDISLTRENFGGFSVWLVVVTVTFNVSGGPWPEVVFRGFEATNGCCGSVTITNDCESCNHSACGLFSGGQVNLKPCS